MSSRPHRDFLLDAGAVTALAADTSLLEVYQRLLKHRFNGLLLVSLTKRTNIAVDIPR